MLGKGVLNGGLRLLLSLLLLLQPLSLAGKVIRVFHPVLEVKGATGEKWEKETSKKWKALAEGANSVE